MSESFPDPELSLELLRKARNGDREALNDLLELLRPWMKSIARATQARGGFDSSDVVQDAQVQITRKLEQFQGTSLGEFRAWVRTILRNQANTLIRHERHTEPPPNGSSAEVRLPADGESPSGEVIRKETSQEVRLALSRLDEEDRQVIRLRELEDKTFEEIARVMGLKVEATRQRHRRALRKLREELEQRGGHQGVL